jgi:ATP:ADP antiporter, AAA family
MNAPQRWLGWALPATPRERAAALWSFAYFFALLAGYYVLRPLRDQMGIAGGVKNLPWLFTATFLTLIVAQPLYGALVCRARALSPWSIISSSSIWHCSGCSLRSASRQ